MWPCKICYIYIVSIIVLGSNEQWKMERTSFDWRLDWMRSQARSLISRISAFSRARLKEAGEGTSIFFAAIPLLHISAACAPKRKPMDLVRDTGRSLAFLRSRPIRSASSSFSSRYWVPPRAALASVVVILFPSTNSLASPITISTCTVFPGFASKADFWIKSSACCSSSQISGLAMASARIVWHEL